MKKGFNFELYEMVFENCFIHASRYKNGNLQLSLFGIEPTTNETTYFADITLEQSNIKLKENEIIVDCKYKTNFITQLKDLGILKEQTGIFVYDSSIYPIYTIDLTKLENVQYCMQELIAA